MYDYLIVGAGLFGQVFARQATDAGKKVLVIKDSYAHCFVPFMAENCSQIDMVDLRYYLNNVSALTEQNSYDEVLILYGISNMCEANDLAILQ